MIHRDTHPLPRIDSAQDMLICTTCFTIRDLLEDLHRNKTPVILNGQIADYKWSKR